MIRAARRAHITVNIGPKMKNLADARGVAKQKTSASNRTFKHFYFLSITRV